MVSQNNLTPIRSFPDGARLVNLDPFVLRNVHAVIDTQEISLKKIYDEVTVDIFDMSKVIIFKEIE